MKTKSALILVLVSILTLLAATATQVTLFVVQPIGAVPEGKTLVIMRMNKTKFIDSADAMCEREAGQVSLLCRGLMLGTIKKKADILVQLPYSEWLYLHSTDGKHYRR